MKKAIKIIACFAFLVFTMSAFTDGAKAPAIGYMAPDLELTATDSSRVDLSSFKGENILVTFWCTGDPSSRIRCNEYTSLMADNHIVEHIAVNFDVNKTLFEEVVKRDNLTASKQYRVSGQEAHKIMSSYHLDRGMHSFLINRAGRIVAIDPDIRNIESAR
ncbi:MAG: redoxin family protein [Clostridiales bacterium]|nr:redoxin family protein [Clostridiales bacterium]